METLQTSWQMHFLSGHGIRLWGMKEERREGQPRDGSMQVRQTDTCHPRGTYYNSVPSVPSGENMLQVLRRTKSKVQDDYRHTSRKMDRAKRRWQTVHRQGNMTYEMAGLRTEHGERCQIEMQMQKKQIQMQKAQIEWQIRPRSATPEKALIGSNCIAKGPTVQFGGSTSPFFTFFDRSMHFCAPGVPLTARRRDFIGYQACVRPVGCCSPLILRIEQPPDLSIFAYCAWFDCLSQPLTVALLRCSWLCQIASCALCVPHCQYQLPFCLFRRAAYYKPTKKK